MTGGVFTSIAVICAQAVSCAPLVALVVLLVLRIARARCASGVPPTRAWRINQPPAAATTAASPPTMRRPALRRMSPAIAAAASIMAAAMSSVDHDAPWMVTVFVPALSSSAVTVSHARRDDTQSTTAPPANIRLANTDFFIFTLVSLCAVSDWGHASRSASKQVRSPVWHAPPRWYTRNRTVSPSQSSDTDSTCWVWPLVAPLIQYSWRERE